MSNLRLQTINGPEMLEFRLTPGTEWTIGRKSDQDIRLNHPSVSRSHASIQHEADRWTLTDLDSRHGTQLKGITLHANDPTPIDVGDRISIGPWLFLIAADHAKGSSLLTVDDLASEEQHVTRVGGEELDNLAMRRLRLLIDSVSSIHEANDEPAIAQCAVQALVAGTGYDRAVFVRPIKGDTELDVLAIASGRRPIGGTKDLRLSRTLIRSAHEGIVRMEDQAELREAVSIVSMGVAQALCAPVTVGEEPDSFLYLDSSTGDSGPQPDAAAFCAALSDMVALALANLRRRDLERRHREMERDLHAARDVQLFLLPPERGSLGRVEYARCCQPGRTVGGDLFGVVQLADDRAAFFLGDVAGKGMGAAMQVAAIHPMIVAWLEEGVPLLDAVARLNHHMVMHTADGVIASMFIAVIDTTAGTMECVDAGHGYVAIASDSEAPRHLECSAGGMMLGTIETEIYQSETIAIKPGDRLVLFSDGVIEQRSSDGTEFGFERVLESLTRSQSKESDIEQIMSDLESHAGGDTFADDVTIASIHLLP